METDDSYPEVDSPWTLYFNGAVKPRWSNCWCIFPLLVRAEDFMRDWDEPVAFPELWRLHCRIDHLGGIESENPDAFQVCCLTLAFLMLRDEEALLESLTARSHEFNAAPRDIFAGVRDGLFAMHQRSKIDGIAFWTNGYKADRAWLCESIRRHCLPQNDPQWLEAPHIGRNRSETQYRATCLQEELRALDFKRLLPKEARRLIHELSE